MTQKRMLTGLLALLVALTLTIPALADGPSAVAWIKTQQNADGGFGSPDSTPGATADAVLAAAASGHNALAWANGGPTALDYLKAQTGALTKSGAPAKAGELAKVILALTANAQNPRTALGSDLIEKLESMLNADGRIGTDADFVNEHAMSMIALASAGRSVSAGAVNYLLGAQIADGSWSWNGDTTPGSGDNNTAAIAVVALRAAGVPASHPQIAKTIALFHEQQNENGGFPYVKPSPWGTDSDANSTAVVIWALIAAGEDPAGVNWKLFGQDGTSAYDRLKAFQNASGAFRWQDATPDDNWMSTVQAMIALEMKTLPFARMDVGEAAAQIVPGSGDTATVPPPELLPTTGAASWLSVIALLGSGAMLTGVGLELRRKF